MTLSSSGILFVLNAESHTVSVIDIEKEKIYVRFLYLNGLGIHFDGQSIWIGGHGKQGT